MKIIQYNKRDGILKLRVDNKEDLWILSRILNSGDIVSGQTTRAVKKHEGQESKRIKIKVKLETEKIEFQKNNLRVLGKITESSSESVSHGSYHALAIEEGETITIKKDWKSWQIKRLEDAVESTKKPKAIICAADYGDATIAILGEFGIKFITDLNKVIPGKKKEAIKIYEKSRDDFLFELAKLLQETSEQNNSNNIIVGGVGFLTENFKKVLDNFPKIKNKISLFKIFTHGKTGINELIKIGAVEKVIKGSRISDETALIEKLFSEISMDGKVAYGFEEVKKAVECGAVEYLLVSDIILEKSKEDKSYEEFEELMKNAEKSGAKISIISSEHDAGERFSDIQIGALLRFKV